MTKRTTATQTSAPNSAAVDNKEDAIREAVRKGFELSKSPFIALKRGLEAAAPTEGMAAHNVILRIIEPELGIEFGHDARAVYVQNYLHRGKYPIIWQGCER